MRGIGSVVGLLIVVAIGLGVYKLYFSQIQAASGSSSPNHTLDVVGVQNDLLSIAQAERIYQAQHSEYGSLADLTSSGAMSVSKPGRDGYTYEVETTTSSYRVIAHCPVDTNPGCSNYAVDDSMQVQAVSQAIPQ
jgi:hypothetical protein